MTVEKKTNSSKALTGEEALKVLPAVAKSFSNYCKKCEAERYHKVLTHVSETSAKVECEICHSKSTFKLNEGKKKSSSTSASKSSTSAARSGSLTAAAAAKSSKKQEALLKAHTEEYEKLASLAAQEPALKYNMKLKFQAQQKLEHPKFGTGIVRAIFSDKVEVVFPDEVRHLVHNRGS